ncbi:hypothetical protein J4G48_0003485 [Bradyrhizobium barranii subsp. apii]|uniref:hypothetical protein n=1 Tax=Bradyrhizobium barranii TaxID=2992140 RepID=UPI001AA12009|nr:hypothetical protein [Bradyrhizobium barranii]UPT97258.1 hypothetical protein J4G48_0003485 [Bradyrhizobium barranii subsp. apii]
MAAIVFTTRLFGGHDIGITFDSIAGTLAILGQSITISSLPASLQQRWSDAIGGASSGIPTGARGPFGGDNIGQAVGAILDGQPVWRNAVQAALAGYLSEQSSGGPSPETWTR